MQHHELTDRYLHLRGQLETAYAAPVWDSRAIDDIAEQLLPLERALGSLPAGEVGDRSRRLADEA